MGGDNPVTDNEAAGRFELVEDEQLAELVYRRGDGRLILVHTGVPDDLEGRGIGGRLVAAAVEDAAGRDLTVVPNCPFARAWLRRHPEAASQVAVDWPPD